MKRQAEWPHEEGAWPSDFLRGKYAEHAWVAGRPEKIWHICEQCGHRELLTPQEAFDAGWDYPPVMGVFGVLTQRNCPKCRMDESLYWRVAFDRSARLDDRSTMTPHEQSTLGRILMEPESLRDGREYYYYMFRHVAEAGVDVVVAIDAYGGPAWQVAGIAKFKRGEVIEERWFDHA